MENLKLIRTLAELKELQASLAEAEFIAYDIETTGLNKEAEIIGFSISTDVETGYYVVLSEWNIEKQALEPLETLEGVKEFLGALKGKSLITHNGVFDCAHTAERFKVELMPYVHTDTMILAHLLDENRSCGLKDLGALIFGEDVRKEQAEMRASVLGNGGQLTKACYELYKADSELIGRYGAKDAILTLKLFYHLVPELYEQGLDKFFYEDESMPLFRGPTYDLNTVGLRVDADKLSKLRGELESECLEAKAFILKEIAKHIGDKYPGTSPAKTFNIDSGKQIAWLLFDKLEEEFGTLTEEGRNVCKALGLKLPYSPGAKREFIHVCKQNFKNIYEAAKFNPKTKKMSRPKKVGDFWNYLVAGKETLYKYMEKYKWVERLLEYSKNKKLLTTYAIGIQSRMLYNTIHPSFLQHGTTSGRYSSRDPNFQNLPRDDKRVKACIISRPGKVFVGADYSQLEPRVFASFSGDERLQKCFNDGDDFYSVVGTSVFGKTDCSLKKADEGSFAKLHPELRQIAKEDVSLASAYGTTAWKMSKSIDKPVAECQEIINNYFEQFPSVHQLMLDSHNQAKTWGYVTNLFGRPRRMPKAKLITKLFGSTPHEDLPYEWRNLLNLAMNHRIQSTGASIMNRAAIAVYHACKEMAKENSKWLDAKIVMQVHDELILEVPKGLAEVAAEILKQGMETTTTIPGVELLTEPKIANNLADLK